MTTFIAFLTLTLNRNRCKKKYDPALMRLNIDLVVKIVVYIGISTNVTNACFLYCVKKQNCKVASSIDPSTIQFLNILGYYYISIKYITQNYA